MKYICQDCFKEQSLRTTSSRCDCGGIFQLGPSKEDFEPTTKKSMWRYESLLLGQKDGLSLGEGGTPLIEDRNGHYLKLEMQNPTFSFKDRGSVLVISRLKDAGVKDALIDSSGNAAISMACYAKRAGITLHTFIKESMAESKKEMLRAFGATIHSFSGSRDELTKASLDYALDSNVPFASHIYDPLFYHGVKTYFYEVYEELGHLPSVIIPVGNGTLLFGFSLAVEEMLERRMIDRAPKLYLIQPKNCSSLKGQALGETLAEGVAVFKPMRLKEMQVLIEKYQGELLLISEEEILEAYRDLNEEGIYAEFTAALSYAGRKYVKEKALIPITSAGFKNHGVHL